MYKKIKRKQFLKIAAVSNVAFLLQPLNNFATALFNKIPSSFKSENVTYFKNGSLEYEQLRKGFNKRINKYPLIIALCKNTLGVSEAIKYAIENNLPVTVKSGGHCMEGFSCNEGGMVINLSLLKNINWVDNETIVVEPGCTLSNLYDILLPKKRILPGGSCAGVGIGGLTLGGGYGLLARKFGLTCDSLQEVIMVDGKGVIRTSKDDAELLWACKGGGNGNFGVITSLKFKTHKAPATLQSFRFKTYKATSAKATSILKLWFEVTEHLPVDCFSAFVLNGKTVYILLTNAGKHTPEVEKVIKSLSAASEKTSQTKQQPLASALKVYYGRSEPLYFKNASAGLYKNYEEIEKYIELVIEKVMATPGMIYQVNTLGGNIENKIFESESAFPHRACRYFSELQTYWETEKQSARLLSKFEEVQQIFTQNGVVTQYRNYPDINFKNWSTLYYGANYARLQNVKNKYDPANIVTHQQSISNL